MTSPIITGATADSVSMATKLLELAERCEQATGSDRELDAEIAVAALGMERDGTDLYDHGERYSIREPDYYDLAGKLCELPAYTASLDAAMMLVPEGKRIDAIFNFGDGPQRVYISDPHVKSAAATPALALCAAALRARAAQ